MNTVLVTGANGFVGTHLCTILQEKGYTVRRAVRTSEASQSHADDLVQVGDIDANTDWSQALDGVDAVVHLAARVHVLNESSDDPLASFREVNTHATEKLASQAAEQGIRRFVYISSIKACVSTTPNGPQREADPAHPEGPYGQSKYEAELALLRIAEVTQLEPVVIRPPLVYGPGVGGNFLRLLSVVQKRVPLPLRGIKNGRSLVSVYNLCDLIALCLDHPAAPCQVFNVSDGHDLSTPELLTAIGSAMNRRALLWPVPSALLRMMFKITGRPDDFDRLFGSLQVSISKARNVVGWTPALSIHEGLQKTVRWYCDK